MTWTSTSLKVAHIYQKGPYQARKIREWTRAFIKDRHDLPLPHVSTQNITLLDHGNLREALLEYLQGVGKYVCAMHIVDWTTLHEIQAEYNLTKSISLGCAQEWMKKLGY